MSEQIITQPASPTIAPPPPIHWGSVEGVMLIVTALSAIAAAVEGFTNKKELGKQSRQLAGLAEKGLAAAEFFVPGLKGDVTWDNDLRRILKAYSKSNPTVAKEMKDLRVSPNDVADLIHNAYPEFVAELIDLPPIKAREAFSVATQEAALLIHGDPEPETEEMPAISPEMQASRDRLAEKLAELHPGRRKN